MNRPNNTTIRWRPPVILLISIVGGVVAVTGNYTTGILAILGVAFPAGIDLIILSRFLKY